MPNVVPLLAEGPPTFSPTRYVPADAASGYAAKSGRPIKNPAAFPEYVLSLSFAPPRAWSIKP